MGEEDLTPQPAVHEGHRPSADRELLEALEQSLRDLSGAEVPDELGVVDLPGHGVRVDDHIIIVLLRLLRSRRLLLGGHVEVDATDLEADLPAVDFFEGGLGRWLAAQLLGGCRGFSLHSEADGQLFLLEQDHRVRFLALGVATGALAVEDDLAHGACPLAQRPAPRDLKQRRARQPGEAQLLLAGGLAVVAAGAVLLLGLRLGHLEDRHLIVRLHKLVRHLLHGVDEQLVRRFLLGERCAAATLEAHRDLAVAGLSHPERLHVATAWPWPQAQDTRGCTTHDQRCCRHRGRRRRRPCPRLLGPTRRSSARGGRGASGT
mmetsp:Transcript_16116/g.41713  ORF Transcript_16116/g.41713 Transcript_16116/m.41713 type:complete len:319 (+) Transcript_16116:1110-2066(+)